MSVITQVEVDSRLGSALLRPDSVAIVGASDDIAKTTARPLAFLRRAGFEGRVYPINPRRESVLGEQAWPSIAGLPETPDHVFVVVDTRFVVDAVRECGERGVPLVTVLSGGFAEAGELGAERQEELLQVARTYGVRIVGPNSIGVVNPGNGMLLTANAAFGEEDIPVGRTFVASQSGSVIGSLMTRAKAVGIGFAGLVSTGSEIDLTLGDICASVVDDDDVDSFCLFLESLDNAAGLAAFARRAAVAGKPVTVYKLGRSDAAAELSVSHTGALAGEDSEANAFFDACGFVRVENFEALFECGPAQRRLAAVARRGSPRVGVITSTGGGAALAVDELETRGLSVTRPSAHVIAEINAAGIAVSESLIIDLTLAGTRHDKVMTVLGILEESEEFDALVFVIGSSARLNPELAASAIEEFAPRRLPVLAWALPDALTTVQRLNRAGVPAFRTVESCAESVAAALATAGPRDEALDIDRTARSNARTRTLDEHESAQQLTACGARFPATTVLGPDDPIPADLTYPVVVKILSDEIAHKSDVGGVVVGVADEHALVDARAAVVASVARHRPGLDARTVLVQEMVPKPVQEVLVGYRVSETVGPIVLVAAGGVTVELYGDTSVRLAPVSRDVARQMVAEVRATELSRGFRGATEGDLEELAALVESVSTLATRRPDVVEAEINPVAVLEQGRGVIALDALVRVRDESTPHPDES